MNAEGRTLAERYKEQPYANRDYSNNNYPIVITNKETNDMTESADNLRSRQRRSRSSAWRTNGMHLHLANTKNFNNLERNENTTLSTPKSNLHWRHRNERRIGESAERARMSSQEVEKHANFRGDINITHTDKTPSTHYHTPRTWTDKSPSANTGTDVQKMLKELVNISHNLSIYMQTKEEEATRIDYYNNNNNNNNNERKTISAKQSLAPLSSMQTTPRQRNAQLNVSEIERIVRRVQAHYTLRIRELELTNEQLKKEVIELKKVKNAKPYSLVSSKCRSDEDELDSHSLPSEKKENSANQVIENNVTNSDDVDMYTKKVKIIANHSLNNENRNTEKYDDRKDMSIGCVEKYTSFAEEQNSEGHVMAFNSDGVVEKLRDELQQERRQRLVVEEQTQKLSEQHVKVVSVLERRLRKQEEQIRRLINLNRNRWEAENKSEIYAGDNSAEMNEVHDTLNVHNYAPDKDEQKCTTDVRKESISDNTNIENEKVPMIKNKYSSRQKHDATTNNDVIKAKYINTVANRYHHTDNNNNDNNDDNENGNNSKKSGTLREMQNKEHFDVVSNTDNGDMKKEIEDLEEDNVLLSANKKLITSKATDQENAVTTFNHQRTNKSNCNYDMEQKSHEGGSKALSGLNRSNAHDEVDEIEELLNNISRELESIHTSL